MNNVIWKYKLELTDRQTIVVPIDWKVLDVQIQAGLCMWVLVDLGSSAQVPVEIAVIGTGNHWNADGWIYAGTVQQMPFVWHVFYRVKQNQEGE